MRTCRPAHAPYRCIGVKDRMSRIGCSGSLRGCRCHCRGLAAAQVARGATSRCMPHAHGLPRQVQTAILAARSCSGASMEGCGNTCRGVAQPGSASAWGAEGRRFESGRPDHSRFRKIPPDRRDFLCASTTRGRARRSPERCGGPPVDLAPEPAWPAMDLAQRPGAPSRSRRSNSVICAGCLPRGLSGTSVSALWMRK